MVLPLPVAGQVTFLSGKHLGWSACFLRQTLIFIGRLEAVVAGWCVAVRAGGWGGDGGWCWSSPPVSHMNRPEKKSSDCHTGPHSAM